MDDQVIKKPTRTYAFDFDGVITQYQGFKGEDHFCEPNLETIKAIRLLKEQGNTIIIYSTRSEENLAAYCKQHDIPVDYINHNPEVSGSNPGKPVASVYIDDHAVCYHGQTAEELVAEIINFKTYWQ
ncbi:MAG: hypothetical protein NTV81_03945 [Candidatus Komeilibacteria bacterium]|nr:hypothetical protein [Candidatus Komeilibacteria bacterium]